MMVMAHSIPLHALMLGQKRPYSILLHANLRTILNLACAVQGGLLSCSSKRLPTALMPCQGDSHLSKGVQLGAPSHPGAGLGEGW